MQQSVSSAWLLHNKFLNISKFITRGQLFSFMWINMKTQQILLVLLYVYQQTDNNFDLNIQLGFFSDKLLQDFQNWLRFVYECSSTELPKGKANPVEYREGESEAATYPALQPYQLAGPSHEP